LTVSFVNSNRGLFFEVSPYRFYVARGMFPNSPLTSGWRVSKADGARNSEGYGNSERR